MDKIQMGAFLSQDSNLNNQEHKNQKQQATISSDISQKFQQIMNNKNEVENPIFNSPNKNQDLLSDQSIHEQAQISQSNIEYEDIFKNTVNDLSNSKNNNNVFKNNQEQPQDLSSIFSSLLNQEGLISSNNSMQNTLEGSTINNADLNYEFKSEIQELANSIISKIQVSDPSSSLGTEVKLIMSSNTAIEGTEIILKRATDGALSIIINTKNENQFKKINETKNLLERALEKHEKGMINVKVEMPNIS